MLSRTNRPEQTGHPNSPVESGGLAQPSGVSTLEGTSTARRYCRGITGLPVVESLARWRRTGLEKSGVGKDLHRHSSVS
jgi:hypothetical protein